MIRDDLAALDITHEVFFSERTLHEKSNGRVGDRPRRSSELRDSGPRL